MSPSSITHHLPLFCRPVYVSDVFKLRVTGLLTFPLDQRLPFSLCQLPSEIRSLDPERRPDHKFAAEEVQVAFRTGHPALCSSP